jgi:hypothetical protein
MATGMSRPPCDQGLTSQCAFVGTNISREESPGTSRASLDQWGKLLTSMIKTLLQTDSDYVYTFLRIIAGIVVFPYGMQKLFGWFSAPGFGAPGIKGSLEQLTARKIPKFIAGLIIIGQSFGSMALMSGFLGRVAAAGLIIIGQSFGSMRLSRESRGRWTVHHLHRCAYCSPAGRVDTELVWIKKGRRN